MKTSRLSSPRAFSLVEVMTAAAITALFVIPAVCVLFFYYFQNAYISEQKLLTNSNTRNFTEDMMEAARDSNYAVLYQAFYPYTTPNNAFTSVQNPYGSTTPGSPVTPNSVGIGAVSTPVTPYSNAADANFDSGQRLTTGDAGDYIVFFTYDDQFYGITAGSTAPNPTVVRIVAFWIGPNRVYPTEVAMYSFDTNTYAAAQGVDPTTIATTASTWTTPWGVTLPAALSGSASAIENMLPQNNLSKSGFYTTLTTAASDPNNIYAKIVINDVRGQIIQPNLNAGSGPNNQQEGLNFMFLQNTQAPGETVVGTNAVLVNSRILDGNLAKHVTDTYYFTINPNG
jgi:hypothetical protein